MQGLRGQGEWFVDERWRRAEAPFLTCEWGVVAPPVAVVHLNGELDMATVPRLAEAVSAILAIGGVVHLEIDAAGLRFMDLRGLEALLALERRIQAEGGTVEVLHPSLQVRRLLDLTDCEHLLEAAAL